MCPWRTRQGNKETPLHTYKPLPDKVTIKMSPIHGLGLFAEDTIKEGELLGMVHYPTVDGNDVTIRVYDASEGIEYTAITPTIDSGGQFGDLFTVVSALQFDGINEYIDLGTPVKTVRDQLKNFSNELDKRRGGSFDADAGEYIGFEGGDDKLYAKRYKRLSAWEKKVKKALDSLMNDYKKAW